MANRAEVSRLTSYSIIGQSDVVTVPRLVAYLILEPGEEEPSTAVKQGHVHAQILRRS